MREYNNPSVMSFNTRRSLFFLVLESDKALIYMRSQVNRFDICISRDRTPNLYNILPLEEDRHCGILLFINLKFCKDLLLSSFHIVY